MLQEIATAADDLAGGRLSQWCNALGYVIKYVCNPAKSKPRKTSTYFFPVDHSDPNTVSSLQPLLRNTGSLSIRDSANPSALPAPTWKPSTVIRLQDQKPDCRSYCVTVGNLSMRFFKWLVTFMTFINMLYLGVHVKLHKTSQEEFRKFLANSISWFVVIALLGMFLGLINHRNGHRINHSSSTLLSFEVGTGPWLFLNAISTSLSAPANLAIFVISILYAAFTRLTVGGQTFHVYMVNREILGKLKGSLFRMTAMFVTSIGQFMLLFGLFKLASASWAAAAYDCVPHHVPNVTQCVQRAEKVATYAALCGGVAGFVNSTVQYILAEKRQTERRKQARVAMIAAHAVLLNLSQTGAAFDILLLLLFNLGFFGYKLPAIKSLSVLSLEVGPVFWATVLGVISTTIYDVRMHASKRILEAEKQANLPREEVFEKIFTVQANLGAAQMWARKFGRNDLINEGDANESEATDHSKSM